jgi:hypothetical protein
VHHQPGGRVGQFADPDPFHRGHLLRINRRHRARLPPPGEHRNDQEPGRRDEQLGQRTQDVDAARVDAHFLGRLAQRGGDRPRVRGLDDSAGKTHLARVPPQSLTALDEQQLRIVGSTWARGEQDKHR